MTKRKSCFHGCLFYGCLPLLVLALVSALPVWYFCFNAPPLVISEATTRITGPLTADGQIDYFRALEQRIYPPEMKTDDNGFRVFTRLFGDVGDYDSTMSPEIREFYRLQKYEKLGLDPNIPPTLTLPDTPVKVFTDFYDTTGDEIPEEYYITVPGCCGAPDRRVLSVARHFERLWTLEEFPMLADWINEIDEPLDAIAESVRKPVFFMPLLQSEESLKSGSPQDLSSIFMPDLQTFREIARIFSARAMYRVASGNIDGAIDDKLTLHRLGRQVTQKACLLQYFFGITIESTASAIPIGANSEHPLTKEQIQRIRNDLDTLPAREAIEAVYELERFSILGVIQSIMKDPNHDALAYNYVFWGPFHGIEMWHAIRFLAPFSDQNVIFRRMNEAYDALQEPEPRERFHSILETAKKAQWEFSSLFRTLTPSSRGNLIADLLIEIFTSTLPIAVQAEQRKECSDNMHRLALAILLYRLEHDTLPDENWVTQIKPYLGDNPEQYFSCPANVSPEGKTTYALILYDDDSPADVDMFLLIELKTPVPLNEAVITVDEVLALFPERGTTNPHTGGRNIARQSGAVSFFSSWRNEAELFRLLGREVETEPDLPDDDDNE